MAPKAATVPSPQPTGAPEGWLPKAGAVGHAPLPPTALFFWWRRDVEPNPELPIKLKPIIWRILRRLNQLESICFCLYPRGIFN